MNVVDSIGVMLGGDDAQFRRMMTGAAGTIDSLQAKIQQQTNMLKLWGGQMSLWISAPLTAIGTLAVRTYARHEAAVISLQSQLAKGVSAKPYVDFAEKLEREFNIDEEAVINLQTTLARFGVPVESINHMSIAVLGLSRATGMGEMMSYRALKMFESGSTMLLSRYIPALRTTTDRHEQLKMVQDLIDRGWTQQKASVNSVSGAFKLFGNAADDARRTLGLLLVEHLGLKDVASRASDFVRQLTDDLDNGSNSTKKWIAGIGLSLAALGPMAFGIGKFAQTFNAVLTMVKTLHSALLTRLLPAIALVGVAFTMWEIGKSMRSIQMGLHTLGGWCDLFFTWLTNRARAAWGGIGDELNEKAVLFKHGQELKKLGIKVPTEMGTPMELYDRLAMARGGPNEKRLQEEVAHWEQRLKMMKTQNPAMYEKYQKLDAEFKKVWSAATHRTAATSTTFAEQEAYIFGDFEKSISAQEAKDAAANKGKSFIERVRENMTNDLKSLFDFLLGVKDPTAEGGVLGPKAKGKGTPTNVNLAALFPGMDSVGSQKPFSPAMERGSREAYSAEVGNASVLGVLEDTRDASSRGADAAEDIVKKLDNIFNAGAGEVAELM
jgi:hypothetical protein